MPEPSSKKASAKSSWPCSTPTLSAGKGAAILRKAGIAVEVGLMSKEAAQLNEVFIKNMMVQKPFIAIKLAQSSMAARLRGRGNPSGSPTNGPQLRPLSALHL